MNKQIEEIRAMARAIYETGEAIEEIDLRYACLHGADNDSETKFMRVARHLHRNGYRKQEWISVDERLPSHLQKVLVCDSFGNMVTAIFLSFDNGGCDWCSAVRIVHEVTHWMALPETPKKYESEGADDETL